MAPNLNNSLMPINPMTVNTPKTFPNPFPSFTQVSEWLHQDVSALESPVSVDLSGLDEAEREQIEEVMRKDTLVKLYNDLKIR